MGVLDLKDSGLIEETAELNSGRFWPKVGLFIEFDKYFLPDPSGVGSFDSKKGAVAVAQLLLNENINKIQAAELAKRFPQWRSRHFNSAVNFLVEGNNVGSFTGLGSAPYCITQLTSNIRTRRFAIENS